MKIRTKLILMLALPVIALAAIAFAGFRDQSALALENDKAAEIGDAIIGLEDVALAAADERLATVQIDLATADGGTAPSALLDARDAAMAVTDQELADARAFAVPLGDTFTSEVAEIETLILTARAAGDFDQYSAGLDLLDEVVRKKPLAGFSSDAVRAVDAIQTARQITNLHEEVWFDYFELTPETITTQSTAQIVSRFERVELTAQSTADDALSSGQNINIAPATSVTFSELSQLRALAEDDVYNGTPDDISANEVLPLLLDSRQEWNAAIESASTFVQNDIGTTESAIDNRRSLFTLLAVLGAVTVFTLMFIIGRSILGPLGRLMDHAEQTTTERLPFAVAKLRTLGAGDDPPNIRAIPRETNDEIGSLVDAFNNIQTTAVDIATDQARSRRNVAEMFVSLGRRNQQLNHRMLNLISDLERDEQDPETLAGLYQLDHLATRMRRNAESLLVLAGNRSPRQWSRPVGMEDVVRQSLAEVELFERIEVGNIPELAMQGNVVTDVTHLLAELLDNATQFSEPSTTVQVSAQETLEGVEIEVFDEGFGIGEKDLVELNERITNPPALDEAPSRLLGLFVVGRLAKQHAIDVILQSQPGVGTVATISLPSNLFAEADRAEIEHPTFGATSDPDPSSGIGLLAGAGDAPAGDIRAELAASQPQVTPIVEPEAPTEFEPIIEDAPVAEFSPEPPAPAIEPVSIKPVSEEPDVPAALDIAAFDVAAPEIAAPEVAAPSVEDATPAWDPAAIHDEQLADAAMPTMEEVEEAMPSFPGVTIDPPTAQPAASDDTWPLANVDDQLMEPSITSFDQLGDVQPAPPQPSAPQPAAETPAPQPVTEALAPQPAAEAPVAETPPAVPSQPTPAPAVQSPNLPAPPIAAMPAPVVENTQPAHAAMPTAAPAAEAPVASAQTFGGLPTRAPQAALAEAEETPSVIPLAGVRNLEAEAKPSNPSAFAAFAGGVNRGLDKVRSAPEPQYSNDEGEIDE